MDIDQLRNPPVMSMALSREDLYRQMAARMAEAADEIEQLRAALAWYGEQARLARLVHSEGDKGRQALAEDGGDRAAAVLNTGEPKG